MKRTIIANCGGFWGDDPTAPRRQVEGGPIDYLVMDYLAEVTMAILQKQRARNAGGRLSGRFHLTSSRRPAGVRAARHQNHHERRRRQSARLPRRGRGACRRSERRRQSEGRDRLRRRSVSEHRRPARVGRAARQHGYRSAAVRRSRARSVGERVPRRRRHREGARARRERHHHRTCRRCRGDARADDVRVRLGGDRLGPGRGGDRGRAHHRVRSAVHRRQLHRLAARKKLPAHGLSHRRGGRRRQLRRHEASRTPAGWSACTRSPSRSSTRLARPRT